MATVAKLFRRLFLGCPSPLPLCQVAAAVAILAALCSGALLGQEAVPDETPENPPAGPSEPGPVPVHNFEQFNGYLTVALTPYLSGIVPPEVGDAEWMHSHDREELRSYLVTQAQRLTQQNIDPEKARIISFVQDKATTTVMATSGIKQFVVDERIATLSDLEEVLKNNQENVLVFVGHVDPDQQEFGGFPIDKLREATKRRGVLALFLGCNTEAYFGNGITHDVDSVVVMERLGAALRANTLGLFLKALTGPDLHLRVDLSLLNALAHRLEMSLVDKHDVVQAVISLQGFAQLENPPPVPMNRLSLLSRFLHISYAMLMSILCSVVLTVLSLLAGAAFPGTLPWRAKLWWTTRRLGYIALGLTLLLAGLAFSTIATIIVIKIVPDHTLWVPLCFLLGGGLAVGLTKVMYETGYKFLKRHPRRLELAAGLISLCGFGTMIGTYLLS